MKAYKIEVKFTKRQKELFIRSQGVCRFVYNQMLQFNKQSYENFKQGTSTEKPVFVTAFSFSKILNNELIPANNWQWIKEVPSKSVKQSLINCERSFNKFFKEKKGFPRFKTRKNNVGVYLPKNNKTEFTQIKRNKIKIPVFGWVHLKEFGRIKKGFRITSCTLSRIADRYFISFLVKEEVKVLPIVLTEEVIGVDLGLKDFATCSNGMTFKSPNKINKIKLLRRKLKREQRKLSRKQELNRKKESLSRANWCKQLIRVQKLQAQIKRFLKEYQQTIISALVRTKPKAIILESLNIKGMLKNRHLSKAVQDSAFYQFVELLRARAKKIGVIIQRVSPFFPSSRLCSACGNKKTDLKLKDRTYSCSNCGLVIDRDENAALNLKAQYMA